MIEATNVTKRYATVTAVRDVSFTVREGEVFALLGPNGAGKSTLLRMVTGLIRPDEGRVRVFNEDTAAGDGAQRRRHIGYLPEERGMYPDMPIRATLVFFGALRGMSRVDAGRAADAWLERLDLGARAKDPVKTLSKGNQQKVQFLTAILHRPRLAILDEPFSGFDPVNQELFVGLIRELARAGTTVLLSAHQMQLVERGADRLLVLSGGRVVALGTLDEIRARWRAGERRLVLRLAHPPGPGSLEGLGAARVEPDGVEITITLPEGTPVGPVLARAAEQLEIADVHMEREALHDLYLRAVGSEEPAEAAG